MCSLWRIRLDDHVRTTNEISLFYAWRSNYDHFADAIALGCTQFLPNQPSVVAATREAVNRCYGFVPSNPLDSRPNLDTVAAGVPGNIKHFAPEADTPRIFQR
jgi:hypothetical protein